MQSDALRSLRVGINGGSIGGLCAGVAFAETAHELIFTNGLRDRWRRAGPASLFSMS